MNSSTLGALQIRVSAAILKRFGIWKRSSQGGGGSADCMENSTARFSSITSSKSGLRTKEVSKLLDKNQFRGVESFVSLHKDVFVGQAGGHQLVQPVARQLGPSAARGDLFAHALSDKKLEFMGAKFKNSQI